MRLSALKFLLSSLFTLCTVFVLFAQVPEDIITESSQPEDEEFIDGVIKPTLIYESRVLAYDPVREADVPWQRKIWRIIDIREKLNLPFAYPVKPFITILLEGIAAGEMAAFQKDDFKTQMTKEEIDQQLFTMDTVEIVDPETYETTVEVTRSDLNPEDIKRFRIKELWFFDEESSRMKVRVLGIAPIKAEYDDFGNFKYEGPMFWAYYPQARDLLAKHRAFIQGNDAAPMTWENMFEMRKFSSYIWKSSNVFDYRMQDFPELTNNPIDRLYESEKIKMDLFNWEHDLWSY
jgi:gliding motility associated protien GldN